MYDNSCCCYSIALVNKNCAQKRGIIWNYILAELIRESLIMYVAGKTIVKELCGNAEDTTSNIYSEDEKCIKN